MKKKIKLNSKTLYMLTGIFSTFTAFQLFGVTVFYLLLLLCAIRGIIKSSGRVSKNTDKAILLFILLMILSCVISIFLGDMDTYWISDNIKKTVTFIVLFATISFFYRDSEKLIFEKYFIKGLYFSVICQMVWGVFQFILWYGVHISLNELVFSKILGMELVNSTWTFAYNSGTIRLTGISWEPAYFSMAMVTGYILAKKNYMKIAFAAVSIFSTSRTGIILLIVAILLDFGLTDFTTRITKKKFIQTVRLILIGIVITIVVYISSARVKEIVNETIISLIRWQATTSGGTHFNYLRYLPNIISKESLINKLFGYGIASSGYPYMKYYYAEFGAYTTSWCPESDVVGMILGLGILGFLTYYYILFRNIKNEKNKDIRNLLICAVVGGVFYIYYGTWVFALVIMSSRNLQGKKDYVYEDRYYNS